MSQNLFKFAPNKQRNNIRYQVEKSGFLRRFFRSKINIILLTILLLMLLFAFISLFFTNDHFTKNEHDFEISRLVKPIFSSNQDYYLANNNSSISNEIINNLKQHKINYKIEAMPFNRIIFNHREYLEKTGFNHWLILGTDAQGKDVLINSLQLFCVSVSIAIAIFILEFFFGFYLGSYLAFSESFFIKNLIKGFNLFISLPDILTILIALLIFQNKLAVYIVIFITGTIRISYWSYNYTLEFIGQDILKNMLYIHGNKLRVINKYIFKNIVGKLLVLFARRINYIIFFIATIHFYGYHFDNNVAVLFQKNWEYRAINWAQIVFPALYLTTFFITFQFLTIKIDLYLDPKNS